MDKYGWVGVYRGNVRSLVHELEYLVLTPTARWMPSCPKLSPDRTMATGRTRPRAIIRNAYIPEKTSSRNRLKRDRNRAI